MNNPHKNARMTPPGRAHTIGQIVEDGRPVAAVAAGFWVSERTAANGCRDWRADGAAGFKIARLYASGEGRLALSDANR